MDSFWLLTAIFGLLIYWIFSKITDRVNYWDKRGVNCTQATFIDTLKSFIQWKGLTDGIITLYKANEGHKYFGYFVFKKPILMLRDPGIINLILIKDFSYFQDRNIPMDEKYDLLNAGLANVTGDKWRVLRHKLTPTFTSGKMKILFNEIKNCSDDLVSYIKTKNGASIEVRDTSLKLIVNVIGSIAFGIKVDALNEEREKSNKFLQMSNKLFKPNVFLRFKFLLFLMFPKLFQLLGLNLVDKEVNKFFPSLIKDIINYRKENNEKRNDFLQLLINEKEKEQKLINSVTNLEKSDENITLTDNKDVEQEPEDLELLEHLKNLKYDKDSVVFSDNVIAAQAFLFVSGGSDSTAAVLSFAFYELAMHEDIQKKIQQEIDIVLSLNEFDYQAVKKMKYLEQFLDEVLRFRTQGPVLTRICVKDYKMPGSDLIIEKGVNVQVPIIALHMDPQYFPDPETFNPDRFEDMDLIPKGVYYPFGGGPRMCIAMRLAMLEMKVVLVTVLKSYNIVRSEKTQLPLVMNKHSFSQHVQGGLWTKFEERSHK